jgi:putative tryptophan/tyrosine transport system substrate-binding protein
LLHCICPQLHEADVPARRNDVWSIRIEQETDEIGPRQQFTDQPEADPLTDVITTEVQQAASTVGQRIEVLHASSSREIDAAFASLLQKRAGAFVLGPGALFFSRRVQLVTLATRHAIPAIYVSREFVQAGGLMSYGTNLVEMWRQVGDYVGRMLKGTNPTDLPVIQSTKLEFVINVQTARTFDLEIPPTLLARADEVIE